MEENEILFYSHLGKLSTQFSTLEYLIREITGLYIVKDIYEDMVFLSIIGKNSLEKNTSLLKELAYINTFGEKQRTLLEIIGKVNDVKNVRNLLIHGLWEKPINQNGEISIVCNDKSFKLTKKFSNGTQLLTYPIKNPTKFKLSTIKKHITQIEELNNRLKSIHEKIKDDPNEYFE